jgi:hypothetical protein
MHRLDIVRLRLAFDQASEWFGHSVEAVIERPTPRAPQRRYFFAVGTHCKPNYYRVDYGAGETQLRAAVVDGGADGKSTSTVISLLDSSSSVMTFSGSAMIVKRCC